MNNLPNNDFNRYVSVDTAPRNSICESKDCRKAAAHRYLVTGGIFHCNNGLFCASCGETYTSHIDRMSKKAKMMAESMPESLYDWTYRQVHDGTLCEQGAWIAEETLESHEEEAFESHEEVIYTMEDYWRWLGGRYAQ